MNINRYSFFCTDWAEKELKCNEDNFKQAISQLVKDFSGTFVPITFAAFCIIFLMIYLRSRYVPHIVEVDDEELIMLNEQLRV